jgi:AraC-like DNA-binding protein
VALPDRLAPFIYFANGTRRRAGEGSYTPGQHLGWMLWLQVDGVTRFEQGDRSWELGPGGIFLAEPGIRARWRGDAYVLRISFDPLHRGHRRRGKAPLPLDDTPQPGASELFGFDLAPLVSGPWLTEGRSLAREIDARVWRDHPTRIELSLRLGLWLLGYVRSQVPDTDAADDDDPRFVQRAEVVMRDGIDKRLTVDDVARMLGMTREHFTRRYAAARGRGPGAFIAERRLVAARRMLRETPWTIDQVARRVGYASGRGLRSAFTRELGMSPGEWRRRQREIP